MTQPITSYKLSLYNITDIAAAARLFAQLEERFEDETADAPGWEYIVDIQAIKPGPLYEINIHLNVLDKGRQATCRQKIMLIHEEFYLKWHDKLGEESKEELSVTYTRDLPFEMEHLDA